VVSKGRRKSSPEKDRKEMNICPKKGGVAEGKEGPRRNTSGQMSRLQGRTEGRFKGVGLRKR